METRKPMEIPPRKMPQGEKHRPALHQRNWEDDGRGGESRQCAKGKILEITAAEGDKIGGYG
jgi:hypothetical protein